MDDHSTPMMDVNVEGEWRRLPVAQVIVSRVDVSLVRDRFEPTSHQVPEGFEADELEYDILGRAYVIRRHG